MLIIFCYKIWYTPSNISNNIPIILAYLPINLFEYLPINRPMDVKEKLHTAKIKLATINLLVISLIPNPMVKESILTLKAKKIILIKFYSNITKNLVYHHL